MITDSLINLLIKEDPKTQKWLYETYKNKWFLICYRYMKDKMVAEDMMIKGFLKIYAQISNFQSSGSFEGWMRKIMVNECLMELRKNKVFCENIENPLLHLTTTQNHNSLEEQDLLKLLNVLPTGCRTIFNLYVFEGYKHKEIAKLLNISESTSKSQFNLAKQKLRLLIPKDFLN